MQRLRQLLKDNAPLIGIIALAILLRILYYGHVQFDDINWITGAKHILAGVFDPNTAFPTTHNRYLMMLIIAGAVKLFGYSHLAMTPLTFIPSLATLVMIYVLTKDLHDKRTALIAAFLFAIFPLNIKYSTLLEADIIISFTMGLCLWLYLKKKSIFWVGIIIGLAFFIKFFNMLIFLVLAYAIIEKKQYKQLLPLLFGFLVATTPFTIYQVIETGNPIFHITALNDEVDLYNTLHYDDEWFIKYWINPFSFADEPALFHFFFLFALTYIFYCIWKRHWLENIYILWFLLGYAIIEFYPLIPAFQRYLIIIEIPMIILSACFIGNIQMSTKKLYVVLTIFLLFSFYQLGDILVFKSGELWSAEERAIDLLKKLPPKDIYITWNGNAAFVQYYLGYQHNYSGLFGYHAAAPYTIYDLHDFTNLSEIHNAYIWIDYTVIDGGTDVAHYYEEHGNTSVQYLKYTPPPPSWHGIYGLTDNDGKIVGGIWDAE